MSLTIKLSTGTFLIENLFQSKNLSSNSFNGLENFIKQLESNEKVSKAFETEKEFHISLREENKRKIKITQEQKLLRFFRFILCIIEKFLNKTAI